MKRCNTLSRLLFSIIALFGLAATTMVAQTPNVGLYGFSNSATTLDNLNATWTTVHSSLVDDAISGEYSLPANFFFNGKPYDRIRISSNGWVVLGYSANSPVFPSSLSSVPSNDPVSWEFTSNPMIAPLWDDLRVGVTGQVAYLSSGTTFKVIWSGMEWPATSNNAISFELTLNSVGNQVMFTYGTGSSSSQQSATVGLVNNATASAPNNYWVFNGNVTPGNLTNNANSNANSRLISYGNLPANASISTSHYDALYVSSPSNGIMNFGNVDANGGTSSQTYTVRNVGSNTIAAAAYTFVVSNAQFSTPASVAVASGATQNFTVTFTGTCASGRNAVNGTLGYTGIPVSFPVGSSLTLTAQQTHPNLSVSASSVSYPQTTFGYSNDVVLTLTNSGNSAYTATLGFTGGNAADYAMFTFLPSGSVTVPANGSIQVTMRYTPSAARHAATANPTTWVANYTGISLVVPVGSQGCLGANVASLPITASSIAPRLSIAVPFTGGNQSVPTLDLGNRVYQPAGVPTPAPGSASSPQTYSEQFLVKNTGSANVIITGLTNALSGTLAANFSANAVMISGPSGGTLAPGNEAIFRVTYTPTKTTSDFPWVQASAYASAPASNTMNTSYQFQIAANTPVPQTAGFWHNYANGASSTFVGENLTNMGSVAATVKMNRGFMRAVATQASSSNQAPTTGAGAPTLSAGALAVPGATLTNVGDGVSYGSNLTVTSYWGSVNDVLPSGAKVISSGTPGTVSFYIVNNGNANARFYVATNLTIPSGDPQGGVSAFNAVAIVSGTGNSSDIQLANANGYFSFILEPLYAQSAGNSNAFVRVDVTFAPNAANTPSKNSFATISADRAGIVQIYTDANLPTSAAGSTEPLNLSSFQVSVVGKTLFNDPYMTAQQNIVSGLNFGSHELADAISSNYPFIGVVPPYSNIGYSAPAVEVARRGYSANVTGFGVRDTVMVATLQNAGNASLLINGLADVNALANTGAAGNFSLVRVTTPELIAAAGAAQPANVTFPFTLLEAASALGTNASQNKQLVLWIRYDAGLRSSGQTGVSSGRVQFVQSPIVATAPHLTSISYNLTGTGTRPFPVVNLNGGNGGTMNVVDATVRTNPVYIASRPVIFDNYCSIADMGFNRDTVHIKLSVGNGMPSPTAVGNVNDNAVSAVTLSLGGAVVDSLTVAGLILPSASTSYFVDYNTPVVIRNAAGTIVRTQDVSNSANRLVTLNPSETMYFDVAFRPTSLMPPAVGQILARVRVPHFARNNNINFPSDMSVSQTNGSMPSEFGDVYKWMDFVVAGSSLRPALRAELGDWSNGFVYGNYLAPNSTVNFNLPYPYQTGVFSGDSNFVALTLRNSQETNTITGADFISTGKIGIKGIFIEGEDFPDFEIVGFNVPGTAVEPNPVAYPVTAGANNGSPVIATGKSFIQWTAQFGTFEVGTPYVLDFNTPGMESENLYIHFKPRKSVNGAVKSNRNAVVRIVTTDLCNPEVVFNLSGRVLDADLVFSTGRLDFGNVQVNDVAQQSFTVTNNGNYPAHFNNSGLNSVGGTALYSHSFWNVPMGFDLFTNNPPMNYSLVGDAVTPINPGDSRTFTVQFSPGAVGRKDATLTAAYVPEVPTTMVQLSLTGRGVSPVSLTLNPANGVLNFGNVTAGQTKNLSVVVSNDGQATVTVTITGNVAPFTHNAPATFTLAAGASRTIDFTFAPVAQGNYSAGFTIYSPDAFGQQTYSVSANGVGTSSTGLTQSSIDFGVVRVFTESIKQIGINNSVGNSTVSVVYTGISGLNSNEYFVRMNGSMLASGYAFTVPAGAMSGSFDVVFAPNQLPATPSTVNLRNAQINFTINGVPFSASLVGEGAVPQIAFEGAAVVNGVVDFGTASGATGAQRQVTVKNVGRFPLNVTQIFVNGKNGSQFTLSNVQNVALTAGASFNITVTLIPGTPFTIADARILAVSNSLDTRSVELTGSRSVPKIGFSSSNVNFGSSRVGETMERTLTITNVTALPIMINQLSLSGANQSEFKVSGTTRSLPVSLSANETIIVTMRFTPSTIGDKSASLVVATSGGQSEIELLGRAVVPGVRYNQQSLNFGNLPVGQSRELSISVENTGNTAVQVQSVAIEGTDALMFIADISVGFTLQPNEARSIRVTFTPMNGGLKLATLRLQTDAGSPLSAFLVGVGGAPTLSVASVADFGAVTANNFREIQLTVNNRGDAPLEISAANLTGVNASEFAVVTPMPVLIASGNSALVTVRFAPKTDGMKSAVLNLINNSGSTGVVELRGNTGVTGVTGETPDATAFGFNQVTPNPVAEFATVSYTLSGNSNVALKLYNEVGGEILTLVNKAQVAGKYDVKLDAPTLPSGAYILRLEAGSHSATYRVNVVK